MNENGLFGDVSPSDRFRMNEHGRFGDVSPSDRFRMNENGRDAETTDRVDLGTRSCTAVRNVSLRLTRHPA
jgi:hypothetical protein